MGFSPNFRVIQSDSKTRARRAELELFRGKLQTPVFMPVGTFGAVRGISPSELERAGASIMLSNTYHLEARPGSDVIGRLGGLHAFNSWSKPILTDSGGFQIFSLESHRKLSNEGVEFRDPYSGTARFFSPERVVQIQETFGSDVMMVLDQCPAADSEMSVLVEALDRTTLWARRSKASQTRKELALFPIMQGGCDSGLRHRSLRELLDLERGQEAWPGLAIGGLSVGESKEDFVRTLVDIRSSLPTDRPRYLMGVGTPRDLVFSVACGIDMFDCVIPSRNARHGIVMTSEGRMNLLNECYREDSRPIDENSDCEESRKYSRAFVRHLFQAQESLGLRIATLHNIRYYLRLMETLRAHLEQGSFYDFAYEFLHDPKTEYLGKERGFSNYPLEG